MKRWLAALLLLGSSYARCKDNVPVKLTDPRKVRALYQLMKDVHELFEAKELSYWIDSGTLLGAVRHKGIIPWDDDLDICMDIKDQKKLLSLEPYLQKLNCTLKQAPFGWVIKGKFCCLDIFLMKHKKGKYIYADRNTQTYFARRDGGPIYYKDNELFPLKKYLFGQLQVWGPSNPYPYLDNYYKNWDTTAKFLVNHATYTYSSKKLRLSESDKEPARPFGPLEESVAQLKEIGTL